jgi:hypothetical protein
LKLETTVKHYEWEMDEITFTEAKETCIVAWFTILKVENAAGTTQTAIPKLLPLSTATQYGYESFRS